jgi:hypothetical protein
MSFNTLKEEIGDNFFLWNLEKWANLCSLLYKLFAFSKNPRKIRKEQFITASEENYLKYFSDFLYFRKGST